VPTLDDLRDERVILLTTFRRDHSPVDTPVNFAIGDDHAYLRTWTSSGKAKRIARNPNVTIASNLQRKSHRTGRYSASTRPHRRESTDGRQAHRSQVPDHPAAARAARPPAQKTKAGRLRTDAR